MTTPERIVDEHIISAAALREKCFPKEDFPQRMNAVAKFVGAHPDIVTGVVMDYECGAGAG